MTTELNARHGTVDDMKDRLVNDLKRVVADADDMLREVTSSTTEGFAATRLRVEGKVAEAKSRLYEARTAVASRARNVADAAHEYVKEDPWRIVGLGVAAGLVIGLLFRRR